MAAARRVCALYALSGFVSLAYQVTWFRLYVDFFGSTNLTFILVLSNFIGGLGSGALVSRPFTRWLQRVSGLADSFRLYGAIELLVTATVPLTVLTGYATGGLWGPFPYILSDGAYIQSLAYQFAKVGLATFSIFIPCFFMGVTFPLLCDVFRNEPRFPSRLYAWNTLGACSGVLVCQFLFIPWIGDASTFWLAMTLNAMIGVYFIATGGSPADAPEALNDRSEPGSAPSSHTANLSFLLTCAVLSGFLAGAIEGDMFRRLKFIGYHATSAMSFASFWAILAIFLASLTVRLSPRLRFFHIKLAFALALVCYSAIGYFAYTIHDWTVSLVTPADAITSWALFFPMSPIQVLLFAGVVVFPAYFLISLLLPYVCNALQSSGEHLGIAYGLNTVSFCLGIITFTWLTPAVSVFYSMKLMMIVFAIGIVFLSTLSENRRISLWQPLVAVASILAAFLFTPSDFDRDLLDPRGPQSQYPMRAMRSDGAMTTYVIAAPGGDLLFYDNMSLSNTQSTSQVYMRLMAHFPLLAHPNPKTALLICYGVGNTASAIATHDTIDRIDVVELNRNVISTASEFGQTTGNVHADPRIHFIHDDGRNFLRLTDRTYDLITSEPPPPLHEGIYRLYSLEYYQEALKHLSPRGMMTQWVPIWQLPAEAADRIISTFVSAFPYALMFAGVMDELILVGSPSPIDLGILETRFTESPRVQRDISRLGVATPTDFLARIFKAGETFEREYAGRRVIRDARNDLADLYLDPSRPARIRYNPVEVIDALRESDLVAASDLEAILQHLGRLTYHADVFPIATLAAISSEDSPGVALADVDWTKIDELERAYIHSKQQLGGYQNLRPLEIVLEMTNWQLPAALLELGNENLSRGNTATAVALLRAFVALEPNVANGQIVLNRALEKQAQASKRAPSRGDPDLTSDRATP